MSNPDPIVSLELPVENKGTIHIVPTGKIMLYDTDGSQLTRIGKEFIKNENGAIVGERIVDYLTINEENGNVLPDTNRAFTMHWYGFAHNTTALDGTNQIEYQSPGDYYSQNAQKNIGFLYPWEKLVIQHSVRHISAHVHLSYMHPVTRQIIARDTEISLEITYDEIVKTWNTGLLTPLFLIILFWWWIVIWRRRRYRYTIDRTLLFDDDNNNNNNDEIAVLERAQRTLLARTAAQKTTTKKDVTNNTVPKTTKKTPTPLDSTPPTKKVTPKKSVSRTVKSKNTEEI